MARAVTETRIFVASPGDLGPERDALDAVADDLTHSFGEDQRFRVLRWERDAYPGMGRPQGVVNDRIGDDYDIFVGIMWKRFGTDTGVAGSGTVEEFDRAYARWKSTGQPPILFYFCERPFFPGTLAEQKQLGKVTAFRERIQQDGITGRFETTEEFKDQVRRDLARTVRESGTHGTSTARDLPVRDEQPAASTSTSVPRQPSRSFDALHVPQRRRQPTDQEKRQFVRDGFATIREYFRQAGAALETSDSSIHVEVEEDTKRSFICEVFVEGASKSRCRVWIGGSFGSGNQISFVFGNSFDSFSGNSMNDYVSVGQDDLGTLLFKASGMSHSQSVSEPLDPEGAAEHFWRRTTDVLSY